ncbi:ankyrin repeat domain-containing protein [Campylobacter sp. 2014D-0216]|uniref:ankyrin repeat domain-containing protein n=1 Tax=Campylobacter sp. 2014D-0216 TaxID=1813595 RepID=UPI0018A57E68|nr:ankyrin repeat domain-containing protein [Campylobacter sp. 2014D-0216]QOR00634.1 ankyrin repeat domain-containing protein [Campylobacter sp. 2014D-0216]
MRILLLCLVFSFHVLALEYSCEYVKENKNDFFKEFKPENTQDFTQVDLNCKISLKNNSITKKLYALANEIRGSNSACMGGEYFSDLRKFDFKLLKIALDPNAYQKDLQDPVLSEEKFSKLKAYFRFWAYQSIGNFKLFKEFWKEYNSAINPLTKYFQDEFHLDKASAIYYASNALNEFLNWAVGETKIFKDISDFEKFVANKNNSLDQIKEYIYSKKISNLELNNGFKSALLNNRESEIIAEFIKLGAKINEGYESALFFALDNANNVKVLLDNKAEIDYKNSFGKTPLFYAVEYNNYKVAKLLLENGANVNQKYINDNEKLSIANMGNNTPYFITLCALEHTSKNIFMHAANYADVKMLKLLIDYKANYKEIDDLGFNALDFALIAKKEQNAKYLRKIGLKENENLMLYEEAQP